MPNGPTIAIFSDLLKGPIKYGTSLLVEFDPQSLWYETSLTVAAHALRNGAKTEYHVFQRQPGDVKAWLVEQGLDIDRMMKDEFLVIMDSYSVQTGLSEPETPQYFPSQSVKLADWSIALAKQIKGATEADKRWLHIDDNTAVLLQYNQEKEFIDLWRTRLMPTCRACEVIMVLSLVTGVASDSFYRQVEAMSDAIIQFRSQEEHGKLEHYARVSLMRGRAVDTRWHKLSLQENGQVRLAD